MGFGEKLRTLRKSAGLTQKQLAERIGTTQRTVASYENGYSYPRTTEVYNKLSQALDVDLNYLLTDNDKFIMEAKEQYGLRGAKQARKLVNELTGLFAGGEVAEEDMEELVNAIQEAYWTAKLINKKYTPKKYRKS